jgi:hypothetical protein
MKLKEEALVFLQEPLDLMSKKRISLLRLKQMRVKNRM